VQSFLAADDMGPFLVQLVKVQPLAALRISMPWELGRVSYRWMKN
jgi:hypothetical protein